MWLQGSFVKKAGNSYLRYEEIQEDLTIRTTIRLEEERAVILRSGAVKMRLVLNTKERENGHYESPYGSLPLETRTNELVMENNEDSKINGRFLTRYDLIIGGNSAGKYTLEINYSEVN
jgi:uncharacterized beta-barrel protein YwiB (DUF1934 family)